MRREITNPVKRFSPAVAAADTVKVIFNAGTNDQSEDFFEKVTSNCHKIVIQRKLFNVIPG